MGPCAGYPRWHQAVAARSGGTSFSQRLLPEVRKLQKASSLCFELSICLHCFQECYAHLASILPIVFEFRQVLRPRVFKQLLSGERFHLWVAKTEWRHTHPVTFSRVGQFRVEMQRAGDRGAECSTDGLCFVRVQVVPQRGNLRPHPVVCERSASLSQAGEDATQW